MKTKLRRLTAMVLAVSMTASMIGIMPAFASNNGSHDQISQGNDGYYYYEQLGNGSTIDDPIIPDDPYHTDRPIGTTDPSEKESTATTSQLRLRYLRL